MTEGHPSRPRGHSEGRLGMAWLAVGSVPPAVNKLGYQMRRRPSWRRLQTLSIHGMLNQKPQGSGRRRPLC